MQASDKQKQIWKEFKLICKTTFYSIVIYFLIVLFCLCCMWYIAENVD